MRNITYRSTAAALLLGLVAACTGDAFTPSTPLSATETPEADLNVVQLQPAAAAPEVVVDSFYARSGSSHVERLYLSGPASNSQSEDSHGDEHGHGESHGKEYLRFTLGKSSLLAYPDGRLFQGRDSVLIVIRVTDPTRMLFEFEPAGLTFRESDPAELRINYEAAGDDFDHNGEHDAADDNLEDHLGIWRQETRGKSFIRLASLVAPSSHDVRADLPGFSRYAVSY